MFAIKVNGRFLDLKPGSSVEIERKSPFFAINDYAIDITTDTIAFQFSPNNAIALGLPYQFYSLRTMKKFAAEHYDGETFRGQCTLVIESATLDLNNVEAGVINGYVLYGISQFFHEIEGKLLSELTLGGVRTFNWTTNDPTDGSDGFWQHIHATWTDDTIPYVFAPIRDETWLGDQVEWLNELGDDGLMKYDFTNPIVPLIRTRYLIEQIFKEHGWSVDFSGLNDSDWERMVWVSLRDIGWAPPLGGLEPNAVVTFSLGDHVPRKKTISDFLIQLFNRYGWAPVFSIMNKHCRLVAANTLGSGTRVDWTRYAAPNFPSDFNQDKKVFSFVNDIDEKDTYPSAPDFTGKRFGLPSPSRRALPPPTAFDYGELRFCFQENQWFEVKFDEITSSLEWFLAGDNIYNEEPEGTTDTFETTISTLPVFLTRYREDSGTDYYAYFPFMLQSRDTEWGYRSLFYLGMCRELDVDGNAGLIDIPTASPLLVDHLGNKITGWSNVYRHVETTSSIIQDWGIIEKWFANFTRVLNNGEEPNIMLQLPLMELYNFSWDNVVLIQNIRFVVQSIVEPLPYTGIVKALLKRLVTPNEIINVGAARRVYAHLSIINIRDDYFGTGPFGGYDNYKSCDVQVDLYADAAGTIPYTPSSPLAIIITIETTYTFYPGLVYSGNDNQSVSAQSQLVYTRVMKSGDGTGFFSGNSTTLNYILAPDPAGVYAVI